MELYEQYGYYLAVIGEHPEGPSFMIDELRITNHAMVDLTWVDSSGNVRSFEDGFGIK